MAAPSIIKERRARQLQILLAVLLTLLLHAVLIAVQVKSPKITNGQKADMRSIRMLPAAGENIRSQANLHQWARWRNPLLFAKPLPQVFSSTTQPLTVQDINFSYTPPAAPDATETFNPIHIEKELIDRKIARLWPYQPGREPKPATSPDRTDFPRSYLGTQILPQIFSNPEQYRQQARQKTVNKSTRIHFSLPYGAEFPRIRIATSCGDRELDNAAVMEIHRANKKIISALPDNSGECYIDITWITPFAPENKIPESGKEQ